MFSLCFCIAKSQQTIRFNKQYNFGFSNGSYVSTTALAINNDFIICGYAVNSLQNQNYSIGVIRTDSVGTQKWQKYFNAPGNLQFGFSGMGSGFIKSLDDNIIFVGAVNYLTPYSKACLAKIDKHTGDSLWTKQYTQVGDTSLLFCTSQLVDSSFLSLGYKYFDTGTQLFNRPFILKTDKNGNYLWHKYLWLNTASFSPQFFRVLNINNKDFIAVGMNSYTAPGNKGFILKFDTLGNIYFNNTYSLNGNVYNVFSDIIKLNSGNYLLSGNVTTYHTFNFSVEKTKPLLVEINNTGSLIKNKFYAIEKTEGHGLGVLYQDPLTGCIYATGAESFPPSLINATLYKFNSNLDSLYCRYYISGLGGSFGSSSIYPTLDNGLIMAMGTAPTSGQQQYWLKKVDTLGCDSAAGCTFLDVGIKQFTNNNTIGVFPNPTNQILNIEYDFLIAITTVEVRNIFGQKIKEKTVNNLNKNFQIETADLDEGVYFLSLKDKENVISVVKFLVKH